MYVLTQDYHAPCILTVPFKEPLDMFFLSTCEFSECTGVRPESATETFMVQWIAYTSEARPWSDTPRWAAN